MNKIYIKKKAIKIGITKRNRLFKKVFKLKKIYVYELPNGKQLDYKDFCSYKKLKKNVILIKE